MKLLCHEAILKKWGGGGGGGVVVEFGSLLDHLKSLEGLKLAYAF